MAIHFAPVIFFVSLSLCQCPSSSSSYTDLKFASPAIITALICPLASGPPSQLVSAAPVGTLCLNTAKEPFPTLGCHNSSGTLEHAEYIFLGHVATLPSQLLPVAPNMVLLFPLWSPFSLGLDVGSPLALFLPILSLSVSPQISLLPSGEAWRLASLLIVTLS